MTPNKTQTIEEILKNGFTLEISRFPDAPLARGDQVLYAEPYSGRILIARAPLCPGNFTACPQTNPPHRS